eukprot:TRINITY_DN3577_c0_g1_i1.p1 TRINITY_DN3577_c0_g1~~TRINITY_DN3577_c0_g1_i1.p1  ORF type:complete len:215 (-),score=83.25 TRINITY_DN3577_c0_g1_i1:69-713(-)
MTEPQNNNNNNNINNFIENIKEKLPSFEFGKSKINSDLTFEETGMKPRELIDKYFTIGNCSTITLFNWFYHSNSKSHFSLPTPQSFIVNDSIKIYTRFKDETNQFKLKSIENLNTAFKNSKNSSILDNTNSLETQFNEIKNRFYTKELFSLSYKICSNEEFHSTEDCRSFLGVVIEGENNLDHASKEISLAKKVLGGNPISNNLVYYRRKIFGE